MERCAATCPGSSHNHMLLFRVPPASHQLSYVHLKSGPPACRLCIQAHDAQPPDTSISSRLPLHRHVAGLC